MTEVDNEFMYEIEALMNDGRFEEAADKLSELDEDEMTEELTLMLAHCLSQCARYREALEILEEMEDDVTYDDLSYYIELAGANFGLHRYRTAISLAKHCLEIDENCIEAWLLLCLIYQETGDDEKFDEASNTAREIDEQAWDNIFGDRTDELQFYSKEEKDIVLGFIKDHFGYNYYTQDENDMQGYPVSTLIMSPNEEFDYYRILTVGLGAYRGIEQSPDGKKFVHRVELVASIPGNTHFRDAIAQADWIIKIMRQFGEMIQYDNSWLGPGHTISYGDRLDESVEYDGVIFSPALSFDKEKSPCMLPCGEEVEFLQMIPLYEDEMVFKIENGSMELFNRLYEGLGDASDMIVPKRKNLCADVKHKNWGIPRSSLENILDWDGPDGCYATDRITVENRKVGIMYREPPESRLDSGWRFLAGDEDEDYMNNIENTDIYRLNTICNYDAEIIEYLDNPVGSAFYRNKNGEFRPMDFHSKK